MILEWQILWDRRFAAMTSPPGPDGMAELDLARLDALEPAAEAGTPGEA